MSMRREWINFNGCDPWKADSMAESHYLNEMVNELFVKHILMLSLAVVEKLWRECGEKLCHFAKHVLVEFRAECNFHASV